MKPIITGRLAPIPTTADTTVRLIPTYSTKAGMWTVYEASLAKLYEEWPRAVGYYPTKAQAVRAAE